MIWLLAVTLAVAGKKKDEEPPALDPDALAAEEATACARDVPENYQIHTGFASSPDPSEAVTEARNDARKQAMATLCSGKSATRCAVLRRHIEDWKQPFHNPITGRACAHVGVNRLWIDDDRREQEALAKAVEALADAILAAAPTDAPVSLRAPVWGDSGCDAGPLGVVVLSAVKNAFGRAQRPLAPVGTARASEVTLVVRAAGDRTFVQATVHPSGTKGALPVPGIDVATDLFPVPAGEANCWLDGQMGLPGGQRDGEGGLKVRVDPQFQQDVVCEGDGSSPVVQVNQPARVKVFSVDRLGTAYLVWPPPGGSDLVTSSVDIGAMRYVPSATGGEERLVAVALPADRKFAQIDEWTAFCKHPTPFDVGPWPASAAHAAALAVQRYDDPACLQRDVPRGPQLDLPDVPVCPQRLGP